MPSPISRSLLRLVVLVCAIASGTVGVRWFTDEPDDTLLQLLDYAVSLTDRVEEAQALEARLISEGRPEETFQAMDLRLNAELDWRDASGELRRSLDAAQFQQLAAFDFLDRSPAVRQRLQALRHSVTNRTPAYAMLGASMLLMIGTIVVRPGRGSAPASPAAS